MCGAREGQMPGILTTIHTERSSVLIYTLGVVAIILILRSTPVPSVICLTLMCLCYLCSSDLILLMNYVGFSTWLSIGATVLCIPYLRWKCPHMERPIKVNLFTPSNLSIILISILSR